MENGGQPIRDTETNTRPSVPLGLQVLEKGGFHERGQSELTVDPCLYPGRQHNMKERILLGHQSGNLDLSPSSYYEYDTGKSP